MNLRERMSALVVGHKITTNMWRLNEYVCLRPSGDGLVDEDGYYVDLNVLTTHLDETWTIWQEPGHDWAWAVGQLRQNKTVCRQSRPGQYIGAYQDVSWLDVALLDRQLFEGSDGEIYDEAPEEIEED